MEIVRKYKKLFIAGGVVVLLLAAVALWQKWMINQAHENYLENKKIIESIKPDLGNK